MPYLRLFYHVIWATKERQPFIQDASAPALHRCIAGKAVELGATVHAVGGMEDHIHMAVSVPPTIALSEFIRHVKGSSSHFMNHELAVLVTFAWQPEYGLISFDGKQLASVVKHVQEQRQHHNQHTTIPALERLA
ncbi:MAG: IS200/IS605 family transposase [Dehalococcoidia bacterium]|nr:IS200/IS605 family transposase [Dehalococcoidia bacterium]